MSRIAIVGSGSWGTALALSQARRGDHDIALWSHSASVAESIEKQRENVAYLPGFPIPLQITPTTSLARAVAGADIVISAVPSQHVRATYQAMAPFLHQGQLIVSATKGIEDQTFLRMSQVIEQVTEMPCGSLSNCGRSAPEDGTGAFPSVLEPWPCNSPRMALATVGPGSGKTR